MRKSELFQLVERHKRPEKTFRIGQVLKFHGHDVLRLPPYMCDLSPIELAWAKVKRLIREKNVAGEMSLSVLKYVTMDAFSSVTRSDSEGYCSHVRNLETEYWEKDGLLEDTIDDFIIALGGDESDSSDSNEENEEEEENSSDDSDLALPLSDSE
jgi:hypothetical protein